MDLFLVLSPHLDDAALSCGGLIKRLVQLKKQIIVATIFTADLPPDVSPSWLARRNHSAWGVDSMPFAIRRLEDKNAMQSLNADYLHLGMLDAMYRHDSFGIPFYQKNTVSVPVIEMDQQEVEASLLEKFEEIQGRFIDHNLRVVSPLSLGRHVDHIIVRHAAEKFWGASKIIYYEDYPYAGRRGALENWAKEEGMNLNWKSASVKLTPQEIASRIDAILMYETQVHGLFPSFFELIQEIVRTRISFLPNIKLPENHNTLHSRVSLVVNKYIQNVGGEKYWFTGDRVIFPDLLARIA